MSHTAIAMSSMLFGLVLLATPQASDGQAIVIQCVGPISRAVQSCSHLINDTGPLQTRLLAVRATSNGAPVSGATARLFTTSGRMTPDSVTTDVAGYVFATWHRDRAPTPAVVTVIVTSPVGSGVVHDTIIVATPSARYGLEIDPETNLQTGFEKAPLPYPVYVRLIRYDATNPDGSPVSDAEVCPNYRVAFAQLGKGSMSPDTAVMWYDTENRACVAYGNWTLGEGAGLRDARATLVGANVRPGYGVAEPEAYSRALPRIVGGGAVSQYRGYTTARRGSSVTAKIERTLSDGSTVAYDTVIRATRDTIQQVGSTWQPVSIVGVSAPLFPSLHWLSATVGVDLNSPARDWYVGASLVRPFGRLTSEALPVDVHLLLHFGRSDVVDDPVLCATAGHCSTSSQARWHGIAGMVSVDASSLIAEVLKKFTP